MNNLSAAKFFTEVNSPPLHMSCSHCTEVNPAHTHHRVDATQKLGYRPQCKSCESVYETKEPLRKLRRHVHIPSSTIPRRSRGVCRMMVRRESANTKFLDFGG